MRNFLELLTVKLTYAGMTELPPVLILLSEIKAAIAEINRRRYYEPFGESIVAPGYESFVVPLAESALLKTGAEGQVGHSENGVSRSYKTDGKYPDDILKHITWKVR